MQSNPTIRAEAHPSGFDDKVNELESLLASVMDELGVKGTGVLLAMFALRKAAMVRRSQFARL